MIVNPFSHIFNAVDALEQSHESREIRAQRLQEQADKDFTYESYINPDLTTEVCEELSEEALSWINSAVLCSVIYEDSTFLAVPGHIIDLEYRTRYHNTPTPVVYVDLEEPAGDQSIQAGDHN